MHTVLMEPLHMSRQVRAILDLTKIAKNN